MARQIIKLKRPAVKIDDVKNPETWRVAGRRLLKGAELIWQPLNESLQGFKNTKGSRTPAQTLAFSQLSDHFGAFFVLAGLAVENHLKARLIERQIADGKVLRSGMDVVGAFPGKQHDLVLLAEWAKVPLTANTRALLERLSAFVQWAGRYPIPMQEARASFERTTRENDLEDIQRFIDSLT
jgi:hypothetical protein